MQDNVNAGKFIRNPERHMPGQRTRMQGVALALMFLPLLASAIGKEKVEYCFHTPFDLYLTPVEAYAMKLQQPDTILLVDLRTRTEVQHVGFTEMADANIPFMIQSGNNDWQPDKRTQESGRFKKAPNPDFTAAIQKLLETRGLDRHAPVILMCTAGSRSTAASKILHKAGFTQVYNLFEGFEGIKATDGLFKGQRVVNGWKNAALPWGYRLPASKMYFNFSPRTR